MFLDVLQGIFSMANAFIAFFIVVYAFLFLKKTKSHRERRPWDYLIIASIVYLFYTFLVMLFTIYGVETIINLNITDVSVFFQFLYTGLILLTFISQTDLIFKNEIIIITRRIDPKDKKSIDIKITETDEDGKKKKKGKVYIS